MALSPSSVLKLNSDIRQTRVENEGVILRQNDGEILVVNDVAIHFLELLDGDTTIETAANVLLKEYEVEPDILVSDLLAYAEELIEETVLVEA